NRRKTRKALKRRKGATAALSFLSEVSPFGTLFLTIFSLPAALCSSISYALTVKITITIVRNVQGCLFKKRLFRITSRLNLATTA
ncbi:MAG: hypothetical protein IJX54_06120, partial [Oscillospiraceae bacterium]|nr:hypothetical protein [Oscillospiraceae bacterium]